MLVTKALSQDVTHLAFVPLAEEAARRSPTGKRVAWNGNPPHLKIIIFTMIYLTII
ncbi:hypothetical protein [Lysinibacillus sp. TE18511]